MRRVAELVVAAPAPVVASAAVGRCAASAAALRRVAACSAGRCNSSRRSAKTPSRPAARRRPLGRRGGGEIKAAAAATPRSPQPRRGVDGGARRESAKAVVEKDERAPAPTLCRHRVCDRRRRRRRGTRGPRGAATSQSARREVGPRLWSRCAGCRRARREAEIAAAGGAGERGRGGGRAGLSAHRLTMDAPVSPALHGSCSGAERRAEDAVQRIVVSCGWDGLHEQIHEHSGSRCGAPASAEEACRARRSRRQAV